MTDWLADVVEKVIHAKIKILKKITAKDKFAVLLNKSNGKTVFNYLNNGGIPSTLKDYLRREYIIIEFPAEKGNKEEKT